MEILNLVKTFFKNRDERKSIIETRASFMSGYECEFSKHEGGVKVTCVDNFRHQISEYGDMCTQCRIRHGYYLRLKSLKYENIGILRKLRNLTK